MRKDSITPLDLAIFGAAKFIFNGALDNMVLVVTGANDAWIAQENASLSEVYGNIKKCAVDFHQLAKIQTMKLTT